MIQSNRFAAAALETRFPGLGLRLEQLGAGHRHQRQRNHRRDQDGDRERDGEFAEQPADHVAHEQQRDQHRNQRHRQRDDGEADLLGALKRGLQRRVAFLEIAGDVLDHDDGIVDHEAGGDGQRHQRQIVEAEAEQIHGAQRADQRQRNRKARDQRRARVAQEHEDHQHHEDNRERQLELDVLRPRRGW